MKIPFFSGTLIPVPAIISLLIHEACAAPVAAKPKTAATVQNTRPTTIVVADANDAMGGRTPKNPVFQRIAPKKGIVRGWVKMANGKPLAGAQIIAQSSAAGGFRTDSRARTNAAGLYEIILPTGVCQVVNADVKVRIGNKSYLLPLHPADGELDYFSSGPGHIENFVLRTYGPANENYDRNPEWGTNYYGGHIRVQWFDGAVPAGNGQVQITLTPQGPVLDGSAGSILVFNLPNESGEHFLNDIPLGNYNLSAKYVGGGSSTPIKAQKLWSENSTSTSLPIVFQSKQGDLVSLRQSGVERFEVELVQ